jgi:hypothetical protein
MFDEFLQRDSHQLLRLPPYFSNLYPIEAVWSVVTEHLPVHKLRFKLPPVRAICKNKSIHVTEEDWKPSCWKVKQIDREYKETEYVVDNTTEKLIVSLVKWQ